MLHTTNSLETVSLDANTTRYILDQFTDVSGKKTVEVGNKATCTYVAVVRGTADLDLIINTSGDHANIHAHVLVLGSPDHKIRINCHAHLLHNNSEANIHIISLLPTGSDVDIDGGVDLHKGLSKISGHLLEENVLLGDSVKIKTLPMLDVHSNDVSASHGCRIERLDPKKMFYLQSRGLSKSESEKLMIEGLVETMIGVLETQNLGETHKILLSQIKADSLEYVL